MDERSAPGDAGVVDRAESSSFVERVGRGLAKVVLQRALGLIRCGAITIVDRGVRTTYGRGGGLHATVTVRGSRFYRAAVFGGNIGAAESFVRGEWACDNLTDLCRIIVRNRDAFNAMDGWWSSLAKPVRAVSHVLARNTRAGSRRNIAKHYDLSNEFFSLWLDGSMMYSGGLYRDGAGVQRPGQDLEGAQRAKLDRIADVLELGPGVRLAEIGTGWGGMALHAAERGATVETTTISREQAAFARRRVAEEGKAGAVAVVEEDYRDFAGLSSGRRGRFDALVSIEMVEAVGHQYLGSYFDACSRLLKPGGRFLMQAIVIVDEHYEQALHHVDFIKKHIFPGSFMPCRRVLCEEAARAGFAVTDTFEMGIDYAETLAEWRRRFDAAVPEVRGLGGAGLAGGFDEAFIRMWRWYLCYCEAGFREGHLGVVQMTMTKAGG